MSKRIVKLIENSNYSEREFQALYSLYKYRCLSFDQLYFLHYAKSKLGTRDVDTGYMRRRMAQFKKDGLVEKMAKIEKDCPPLFSLTTDGIKVVRTYFNLSAESDKDDIFATDLSYPEIKVEPKFAFHQYYLNAFAINLNKMFADVRDYAYVDERHMKKSENIRPDGLCVIQKQKVVIDDQEVVIPETHFFLENDMGTETIGKIRQKFERYRAFIESSKHNNDIRLVVLFICKDNAISAKDIVDNSNLRNYQESSGIKKRVKNIKKAIAEAMLDQIKNGVEVFVGTQPKLLAAVKCLYLPEYLGMNKKALLPKTDEVLAKFSGVDLDFKNVQKLKPYTNDVEYDYYAKSDIYHKSFIFLEYFGDPMSVIHKLEFHKKNTLVFRQQMHRELNLVIIANKEENLIALNNAFDLSNPKYDAIMFTTVSRLRDYPLETALFKFTSYGTATFKDKFRTLVPDNTIV